MIDQAEIVEGARRLEVHLQELVLTLEQIDAEYVQNGDARNGARAYAKRVSELLANMRRDLDAQDDIGYRRTTRFWAQQFGSIDRIVDAGYTDSRHAVALDSLITQVRDAVSVLLAFEDGSMPGEPNPVELTLQRQYVEELSRLLMEEAGLLEQLGRADIALALRSEGQSLLAMTLVTSAMAFAVNARLRAASLVKRINFAGFQKNHSSRAQCKDRLEQIEAEITEVATLLARSIS